MTRPRVRRKLKTAKVSRKQKNPLHISFAGVHPLIQKQWDKKKTLKQNYEAMGLLSRLNGCAGGQGSDSVAHFHQLKQKLSDLCENVEFRPITEIQDHPETNHAHQLLDQPQFIDSNVTLLGSKVNLKKLRNIAPVKQTSEPHPFIQELEKDAKLNHVKRVRHASEQEEKILDDLHAKYGMDFNKMTRDLRLNKYQFSAGQLKAKFTRLLLKRANIKHVMTEDE